MPRVLPSSSLPPAGVQTSHEDNDKQRRDDQIPGERIAGLQHGSDCLTVRAGRPAAGGRLLRCAVRVWPQPGGVGVLAALEVRCYGRDIGRVPA